MNGEVLIDSVRDALAQADRDIQAMHRIMSNCYSDEAYREYSKTLRGFVAEKIRLEQHLAELESVE